MTVENYRVNMGAVSSSDFQDKIFKQMSADRKIALGSYLWRLAKDLAFDKINYARRGIRSQAPPHKNR